MKALALITGFLKRLAAILEANRYDFIFIHREASPIGPPIFEWLLSQVLKKKIIYDFDDAIWLTDRNTEPRWLSLLKWRRKVRAICRWSHKISCGNTYLVTFAKNYNDNVVLNPTTIDTVLTHNPSLYKKKISKDEPIVIGWTGSHSTLKYLEDAKELLSQIEIEFPNVEIWVIADRKPDLMLKSLNFTPWSVHSEIEDLLNFDIGIMPLPDDLWTKGKCGFKALQYMALEIPAVVSTVGVNTTIIQHGKNGFLCSSVEDWKTTLARLILDKQLREEIGAMGRQTIIDRYSVESNSITFLTLFA